MATIKACTSCGSEIPGDSRFCPQCGTAQAPNCAACGHANAAGSRFCAQCGARLGEATPAAAAPFTEGFDKPDLQAARTLLTELG
jgi:RNA polymerase subunit RPABC4/transcription elongation factor Spt4